MRNSVNILITGASGFIGTALGASFLEKRYKVVALPRSMFYQKKKLKEFVNNLKPDYIFHLASYGNKHFQNDEDKIFRANIVGTFNLLKAVQGINFKAFINVGSSSEYGIKDKAMKEDDLLDSETFYGVTKASATLLCRAFAKKYNKAIVTVRPFSVYGPNEDPNKFIPTVVDCGLKEKNLKLAPGVHDWIYIDDFINGMLIVAKKAKKLKGRVINIGTGVQTSNQDVVKIVESIMKNKISIEYVSPIRDYDTDFSWVADNSLLKSLGWQNKTSLKEGLKKIINEQ